MKKTILITGVRGFLGSSLREFLNGHQDAFKVYGISRDRCDLTRTGPLKSILRRVKPAYIFHFAGGRLSGDQQTFDANFITTKNLLETVKELNAVFKPRIIIPGSAAEYGNIQGKRLISENCLPKPLGWYGFVKLLQTDLGLFYARQGLDVVVVRMFNICGARTPESLAIGGFAQQIVAIERGANPVIRTKNLGGQRDFLDIEDVCQGLWMIARKGKQGELYNLCSGRPATIRQLLRQMLKRAKVKGIGVRENKKDSSLSFDVIGSNAKLKSIVPWSARVSLERSLENTLAGYRQGALPL